MEALVAFAILLLLMGVVFLIMRPFIVPEEIDEEESYDPELVSQKNRVIDAIREIDMDYQTGKLSDEDYALLRARYTAAAAEILQRLDEQEAADAIAALPELATSLEEEGTVGVGVGVGNGDASDEDAEDAELERRIAERRRTLQDQAEVV